MELDELIELCEKMDIDSSDFVADSEFQIALLECMKERGQRNPSGPPLTKFASSFAREISSKRKRLLQLVDTVQELVENPAVRVWLKKLRLHQMAVWMKSSDFKRERDRVSKLKPVLLFAGSTSSGKSTLLNALLGGSVLPTSHNAATSALCEIKYSSSGKKWATLHIQVGSNRKREEVDLTSQEGIERFSTLICDRSRGRRQAAKLSRSISTELPQKVFTSSASLVSLPDQLAEPEPKPKCIKAEIFWPLEFLKDFTLVDSPGVTEEEGSSAARQITEQFQKDHACGYVYVLDGTRAAEEAAQVGGLLRMIVKATKSSPPSASAVFVVNKWDLVVQQQSDSEQRNFLQRVAQCIEQRWPGFDADRQLVTMNAKIAAQAQELGFVTLDIQILCERIQKTLPIAVENLLLKPLSCVNELLGQVEQNIDSTLRHLHLPTEERIQKHKRDWKQLQSLKDSQMTGSYAKTREEVNHKIDELVLELSHYLKSQEAFECVAEHRKKAARDETAMSLDAENVEAIVEEGFTDAICQFPKLDHFRKWANSYVDPVAKRIIGELARVRGFSTQLKQTSLEDMISCQIDSSRVERVQYIVGAAALALPINWPGFLVSGLAYALGGEKAGTTVMKILCPGAWLYAGLHKKIFWDTTEKVYMDMVAKFCDNKLEKLHQFVSSLLENTVECIGLVCREIPRCIQIMEDELKTRIEQEDGSAPNFVDILKDCRRVKGRITLFMISQRMHHVDITQLDRGEFASPKLVSCVTLAKKGEAMLKKLPQHITERNADEFLKRMTVSRNVVNDHIVSFYGSVVLSPEPLYLGLVFQWCGGGSLADIIYNEDSAPPTHRVGFHKMKTILLQILNGLKYLHGVGIIHAGLTPKTILFTKDNKVKLCEVKSPNCLYTSSSNTFSCNRDDFVYLAPEIMNYQPCSVSCDIYSLGILLWEIWNGRLAFGTLDLTSMTGYPDFVNKVTAGVRPEGFKRPETINPCGSDSSSLDKSCPDGLLARDWEELTCCCWVGSPSARPTAVEVYGKIVAMGDTGKCN